MIIFDKCCKIIDSSIKGDKIDHRILSRITEFKDKIRNIFYEQFS